MTKPLKTINKKQYTNIDKLKIILKNPALWIETFVTIVDKNGKKVPFKLNPQQEQLINGLDKQNIVLKSRQLGITSVSCALSLFFAINPFVVLNVNEGKISFICSNESVPI